MDRALLRYIICPRSSVDRALASEAMCAGSIPAGGTMTDVGMTIEIRHLNCTRTNQTNEPLIPDIEKVANYQNI